METLRCLGFGGIRSFGRVEDGCPQENVIGRAGADWQSLRVDSSDVMPLYHQLKPQIREQAKRLEPDTMSPSEKELMDLSGVGRATVRRAISDLAREGSSKRTKAGERSPHGHVSKRHSRVRAARDRPRDHDEVL
jgi:hypothetical protein